MNQIRFVVGDGWYRGKIGMGSLRYYYGDHTKIAAVLDVSFTDGTSMSIHTGEGWKATQDGPIRL
nr:alpha-L-rhamnosidase N-terminal domain-containing protein [Candidatus Sigynarchaeota archaeon]